MSYLSIITCVAMPNSNHLNTMTFSNLVSLMIKTKLELVMAAHWLGKRTAASGHRSRWEAPPTGVAVRLFRFPSNPDSRAFCNHRNPGFLDPWNYQASGASEKARRHTLSRSCWNKRTWWQGHGGCLQGGDGQQIGEGVGRK